MSDPLQHFLKLKSKLDAFPKKQDGSMSFTMQSEIAEASESADRGLLEGCSKLREGLAAAEIDLYPDKLVSLDESMLFTKQSVIAEASEAAHRRILESCSKLREEEHLYPDKPPDKHVSRYRYPTTDGTLGNFRLYVPEGVITDSQIMVVMGKTGTGKTTFLNILSKTLKLIDEGGISNGKMPNLSIKPQALFPKNGTSLNVRKLLQHKICDSYMNREFFRNVMKPLQMDLLMHKLVTDLSSGEAQRVGLCLCLGKPADVYLIDSPTAYLEPMHRFATAKVIKWFIRHEKKAAVVVERDILFAYELAHGYIVMEGQPFVSCTATGPMSVLAGENLYLSQLDQQQLDRLKLFPYFRKLVDTERWKESAAVRPLESVALRSLMLSDPLLRSLKLQYIRDAFPEKQDGFMLFITESEIAEALAAAHRRLLESFSKQREELAAAAAAVAAAETDLYPDKPVSQYRYPTTDRTLGNFRLHVPEGVITDSQIMVVIGKKGTGKTTFLHILSKTLKLDEGGISNGKMPNLSIKPQTLFPKNVKSQTVRNLLHRKIHDSSMNPEFVRNVMEPLHIDLLMHKLVTELSYGEAQLVGLCLCLGKPADVYLIDSPTAYLEQKQRFATAKVIKWFIRHEKKAAVVVERDIFFSYELAHGYIVMEGQPFVSCTATGPMSVLAGENLYLSQFDQEQRDRLKLCLYFKKLVDPERWKESAAVRPLESVAVSPLYGDEISGEI